MAEETKVIDGKVMLFSIGVVALLTVVICAVLVISLHTVSSLYIEKSEEVVLQEKTIATLQRTLDHTGGKLSVYEAYLSSRNADIVRSHIAKFLRNEQKDSAKATVKQLENWILSRGMGGR